ncbi:MAG: DUF4868 domain-containing protein [Planctomycetaceae bacterium]|jgi:hypothetical protein|nr:DUF4868 domain-containing protein [Planctomycetaceae bacterium]
MKKFYVTITGTTKQGLTIKRINMADDVTNALANIFDDQLNDFIKNDTTKIRFSETNFKCSPAEILFIKPYKLPQIYQNAIDQPDSIEPFEMKKTETYRIHSIFAVDTDQQRNSNILFQYSTAAKTIEKNKFIFIFSNSTFTQLNNPGFIIDSKLVATYKEQKLYFRSYEIVKRFLNLTDYFKNATDAQITSLLKNKIFTCKNTQNIIDNVDDWARKQITSIITQNNIEKIKNIETIQKKAKKYSINIKNVNNTIVFPENKKDIKQLLRFLNEDFYTGEITGKTYMTNSQTPVENIKE